MRRTVRRRRVIRRRRRNPGFARGGIMLPNFGQVLTGVAGGIGAKVIARTLFPQGATMLGGWGGPLSTLGAGIAAGFILTMLKQRAIATAVVSGAATIAAYDAVKLTPLAAQIGSYTAPGDMVPVFSGVGMYPPGFSDPSLSAGNENDPTGFDLNPY